MKEEDETKTALEAFMNVKQNNRGGWITLGILIVPFIILAISIVRCNDREMNRIACANAMPECKREKTRSEILNCMYERNCVNED